MAESMLIMCALEIAGVGGTMGLKQYVKHRKETREKGGECIDDIISSQVKRFSSGIVKAMSRDNTPQQSHIMDVDEELPLLVEDLYGEEKSVDDGEDTVAENIRTSVQMFQEKRRPSTMGINSTFLQKFFPKIRNNTPVKKRPPAKEFERFMQQVMVYALHEHATQEMYEDSIFQSHSIYTKKLLRSLKMQEDRHTKGI